MAELTKDMIEQPEQWRLSMLLAADTLEVAMTTPIQDHSLIYRRLPLDGAVTPTSAFEDLIYDNPLLLSDFGHVDMLIDTDSYILTPAEISSPDTQQAIVSALWPSPQLDVVANAMPCGEQLLMALDRSLLSFVRRTFLDVPVQHPMTAMATYFERISHQGNSGKVYVYLQPGYIDVVAFARNTLRIACRYDTPTADDAVYFIVAAAKEAGFSLQDDEIQLCGDTKLRAEVADKLAPLAQYVVPLIFPSQIFKNGKGVLDASFPLIILPLCA